MPRNEADTNYAANWGDDQGGNGYFTPGRARGMFVGSPWFVRPDWGGDGRACDQWLGLRAMRDGATATILLGEIGRDSGGRDFRGGAQAGVTAVTRTSAPEACLDAATDPLDPGVYRAGAPYLGARGSSYASGLQVHTGFNTILPPNGPSCYSAAVGWWGTVPDGDRAGVWTAGSAHAGGAQFLMGDGAVRFVSETVDVGDQTRAPVAAGRSPYGVWGALGSRDGGEVVGGDDF